MRRMYSKNQLEEQSIELLGSGKVPSIKGDEIIENMEGYSAQVSSLSSAYAEIENIFTGAVKTGNKITFVIACKITKTDTYSGDMALIEINIPSAIGNKLYTVNFGESAYNDGLVFPLISAMTSYKNGVEQQALLEKTSNTKLTAYLCGPKTNDLVVNTEYYVRLEATFLLSENLVD